MKSENQNRILYRILACTCADSSLSVCTRPCDDRSGGSVPTGIYDLMRCILGTQKRTTPNKTKQNKSIAGRPCESNHAQHKIVTSDQCAYLLHPWLFLFPFFGSLPLDADLDNAFGKSSTLPINSPITNQQHHDFLSNARECPASSGSQV
jgi:hypothetical protein